MKKYLSILLALTVITGTVACGSKSDSTKTSKNESTTEETTEEITTEETKQETTTIKTTTKATTEKITEVITEATSSTITETSESVITESLISAKNSMEYAQKINELISITDIDEKYGFLIGAKDGCSFHYNDLSFELYSFPENSPKLEEAQKGTFSFTIEGFGDFTMTSKVNGNFVLMYNNEDNNVIDAFYRVN